MKTPYTVIGFFEDTGKILVEVIDAVDGMDAMLVVASRCQEGKYAEGGNLNIIAGIMGRFRGENIVLSGESVVDYETLLNNHKEY